MRGDIKTPYWLQGKYLFIGFEGDGDSGDGDGGAPPDESGQGSNSGSQGNSGNSGNGNDDGDEGDELQDLTGLKSALAKERQNVKNLKAESRRARDLQKRIDELEAKDKTEVERAQAAEKKAQERLNQLAPKYRNLAIEAAIKDAAREMKFRDVADALAQVDRSDLVIEQDEDDPSEVTVDQKSVARAVKALADKKKYLLVGEGDQDPSGSSFGGGRGKKGQYDEASLKTKYPSLQ